eukprot:Hpha_TRINITY_DN23037_c0_g1::TRINITY_DN23037_c0_g1_i1::g.109343::m.109343
MHVMQVMPLVVVMWTVAGVVAEEEGKEELGQCPAGGGRCSNLPEHRSEVGPCDFRDLADWLREKFDGEAHESVDFGEHAERGRGLWYTPESVSPGEPLLKIPHSTHLFPVLDEAALHVPSMYRLAAALIIERRFWQKSSYLPFIKCLPLKTYSALTVGSDEIAYCADRTLSERHQKEREEMKRARTDIPWMKLNIPDNLKELNGPPDELEWNWAVGIANTRAVWNPYILEYSLVPFVDLLNHRAGEPRVQHGLESKDVYPTFEPETDEEGRAEVLTSYSGANELSLTLDESVWRYGFVDSMPLRLLSFDLPIEMKGGPTSSSESGRIDVDTAAESLLFTHQMKKDEPVLAGPGHLQKLLARSRALRLVEKYAAGVFWIVSKRISQTGALERPLPWDNNKPEMASIEHVIDLVKEHGLLPREEWPEAPPEDEQTPVIKACLRYREAAAETLEGMVAELKEMLEKYTKPPAM